MQNGNGVEEHGNDGNPCRKGAATVRGQPLNYWVGEGEGTI